MSSLNVLPATNICCVLFSRGDGTFHWALAVPSNDSTMANLIHARNTTGSWGFDCRKHDVYNSRNTCVIVKIGTAVSTDSDTVNRIVHLVQNIPIAVPAIEAGIEPIFTCRVWFREAIRVLHANGMLRCPDVYALEREILYYGREQNDKTISGEGYKYHVASASH